MYTPLFVLRMWQHYFLNTLAIIKIITTIITTTIINPAQKPALNIPSTAVQLANMVDASNKRGIIDCFFMLSYFLKKGIRNGFFTGLQRSLNFMPLN